MMMCDWGRPANFPLRRELPGDPWWPDEQRTHDLAESDP